MSSQRRPGLPRRALPLLLLAALTIASLATSALAGDTTRRSLEITDQDRQRHERAADALRQRRAGPEAAAARERSRSLFAGRGDQEALAVVEQQHPGVAEAVAWRPPALAEDERAVGFVGDLSMAVEREGQRGRGLITSNLPLRAVDRSGERRMLDYTLLEREGGLVVDNPLVDVRLPAQLGAGVRVGGMTVRFEGHRSEAALQRARGKGFWGNVERDTDLLVLPTPNGIETLHQLRSVDSPETLRLRFDLPPDLRLVQRERPGPDSLGGSMGWIDIVRDDEVVGRVHPPTAWDADGLSLPVQMSVTGDMVTLRLEHRGRDVRYPLMLDPYVDRYDWRAGYGDKGRWYYDSSHAAGRISYDFRTAGGGWGEGDRGLWLWTYANTDGYYDHEWANWRHNARGDAHIYRAEFGHLRYSPATTAEPFVSSSYLETGLCRWACITRTDFEPGHVFDSLGARRDDSPTLHYYDPPYHWFTHCVASNCSPHSGASSNFAIYRLVLPGANVYRTGSAITNFSVAHVSQWDRVPPTFWSGPRNSHGTWTNATSHTSQVFTRDGGLGINQVRLYAPGGMQTHMACPTDIERNRMNECPPEVNPTFGYGSSEGVHTLVADVVDFSSNLAKSGSWLLKVDRTRPRAAADGFPNDRRAVGAGIHNIGVSGTDDPPSPGISVSGTRRVEVRVDGTLEKTFESSVEGGSLSGTFQFDGNAPYGITHRDTFTDTAGKSLQLHQPESGGPWAKHPSQASDSVITAAGRVRRNGPGSMYVMSQAPPIADYEISADLFLASVGPKQKTDSSSLLLRADPATKTYYEARYTQDASNGRWCIMAVKSTMSYTPEWCAAPAASSYYAGETHRVVFSVVDNQLTLAVDGTKLIDAVDTDRRIPSANRPGILLGSASNGTPYGDTDGSHFDNFSVTPVASTKRYPEGRRELHVKAIDGASNSGEKSVGLIVDRTRPILRDQDVAGPLRANPRIKKGVHDLNITASDPDSPEAAWPDIAGIGRIEVWTRPTGATTWSREHNSVRPNPGQSHSTTYRFDTATHPDGKWDIQVRAYDTAENAADPPITFTVDVDGNGPELTVTGGARDPLGSDRSVHVSARDLTSGVRRIRLWINPPPREAATGLPPENTETRVQSCTPELKAASCELHYAVDAAEGLYRALVVAEDGARDSSPSSTELGNWTQEEWQLHVVNTRSTDRTKLGLEHYFRYDETDAGGGSTIAVNGDGGNAVWHTVPVVNPGRGLSTVVNLTYNSQERGGVLGDIYHRLPVVDSTAPALGDLAGFTYAEAGIGFSLGISGPTRVNEPLGGVLTAQTLDEDGLATTTPTPITMTDADGTLHRFTSRSANYWRDTDGMNLHLRQFKPGGGLLSPIADKWAMTRSDGVTHFFNSHGYLTKTVDRNNNALTYTYENVNGFTGGACSTDAVIGRYVRATSTAPAMLCYPRLTRVTDPGGRNLRLEYRPMAGVLDSIAETYEPTFPTDYPALVSGKAGRIAAIVDHADRRYELTYNDAGYLRVLREAAGTADERATKLVYEGDAECSDAGDPGRAKQLCKVVELRDPVTDGNTTIEETEEHATTRLAYEGSSCGSSGGFSPPRQVNWLHPRSSVAGVGGLKDYAFYCASSGDLFVTHQRLIGTTNATTAVRLDALGRPRTIEQPHRVTELTWHSDVSENKVVKQVIAPGTPEERQETEFTYDTTNGTGVLTQKKELGDLTSATDDRITTFDQQYSLGRHQAPGDAGKAFVADLRSLTPPRGSEAKWTFTVDSLTGNVTERTDALGRVAKTDYDAFGRIIKETPETVAGDDPDVRPIVYGGTDGTQFHETGQPLEVLDQRNGRWRYEYDAVGNATLIADPRANSASLQAQNPFTTSLTYDRFDRLTREEIPKRSSPPHREFITRTRTFDRNGNVTTATDGEQQTTTIEYTKMDQPSRVLAPGSNGTEITRYAYDAADRLIGVVGAKGAEATADGMRAEHLSACSTGDAPVHAHTVRYCLDRAGRRVAQVRTAPDQVAAEQRQITSYAYDRRDNVLGVIDPARNAGRTVQQALDAVAMRDNRRFINVYDKFDQLLQEIERPTETDANGNVHETLRAYGYDKNGNRTSSTSPRNQSWVTNYSYDHRDELESILGPPVQFNEPSTATARPLTCIKRREDGRVVSQTSPRGTAGDHARCTNDDTTDHYQHFTKRYRYDESGDLLEESIPYAPGQYHTPDGATAPSAASWKLRYAIRDLVGNPTRIRDPRGNEFTNEFLDTGELRWTDRPSYWRAEWGPGAGGAPAAGGRFSGSSATDVEFGRNGPRLTLRTDASANAQRTDEMSQKPEGLGETDFGRVEPEARPGLLPQAGATEFSYDDELRLEDVVDARAAVRRLRYDVAGRVQTKSWPYKAATETTAEQRIGHQFDYDAHGNLTSYRDGRGYSTTFAYDGYDRVLEETAPGARSTRDEAGSLPLPADGVAEVTRFDYDLNDNVTLRRTPRGQPAGDTALAFDYDYDSLDRLTREANPAGEHWDYEYDVAGNKTVERRPRHDAAAVAERAQHRRSFGYDALDRLDTTIERGAVTLRRDNQWATEVRDLVTDRGYDLDDNVTRVESPGALNAEQADDETADPASRVTTQSFDGRGLPWRHTEGAGLANERTTVTEYDANGNLRRTVNPVASAGGATPVADTGDAAAAARNATVRSYDEHDLLRFVNLPWDGNDERKFAQEFQRNDSLHRVTSILSPHVTSDDTVARTSYTYYDTDWIKSVSDEKVTKPSIQSRVQSRLVEYDYDDEGNQNLWKTKNASSQNGRLIERTFWANGLLRSRTARKEVDGDASRRVYEYLYNRNRSLVEVIDQQADKQSSTDDRRTVVTRDDVERLTRVNEVWKAGRDTKFAYDASGNERDRWTDGTISGDDFTGDQAKKTTFDYDGLEREVSMTVDPPGTDDSRTTKTTYHASSQRARRTKPNETVDTWLWNGRGELVAHLRDPQKQGAATETDTFAYDDDGNRTRDERGTHSFNARGQHVRWERPVEDGKTKSGWRVDYELNGDGAIVKKTERNQGGTAQRVTDFDYRGERLIHTLNTDDTDPPTVKTRADYFHDDFGNVVRIEHEVESSEATVLPAPTDTDLDPQACDDTPDATAKVTHYCYDEFGRQTFSKGQGVDKPAVIAYDGVDRRDTKQVEVGDTPRVRDYSYVGLGEQLARETTASNKTQTYDYDSSGERQGVDRSDKPYRPYAKDGNGSISGLESSTDGSIADDERYRYDPYGELEDAEGDPIESTHPAGSEVPVEEGLSDEATENPFRFEGFYYDSGVKTYDMHARHYRPDIGRFLSEDRYASAAGDMNLQADPLTQNRYAFAGGNPVSNIEFDGHIRECGKASSGCQSDSNRTLSKRQAGPSHSTNSSGLTARINEALGVNVAGGGGDVRYHPTPPRVVRPVRPPDAGRDGRVTAPARDEHGNALSPRERYERFLSAPRVYLDPSDTPLNWEALLMIPGGPAKKAAAPVLGAGLAWLARIITRGGDDASRAAKAARPASSPVQATLLKRQLASEAQMTGPGTRIIGPGTGRELRDAPRLAREYGGDPTDYVKMTSRTPARYQDGGGMYDLFETHWYENVRTGARYEFKSKFPRAENQLGVLPSG